MTKVEALELALKGKRVKHVCWPDDEYIYYDFRDGKFKEEVLDIIYDVNQSYDVDSWEEHYETVIKYYWSVKFKGNDIPSTTVHMYEKDTDVLKTCCEVEWVEKINKSAKKFRK